MLKVLALTVLCVVLVSGHIHEHPNPNEPTLFGQVWEDFKQGIDWYHVNKPADWANLRQAHVKQHGCVRAKLTVDPSINSKLAVGPIFSNPGKSFDIFARFSSGGGAGFIRKGLSTDRADYEHASDTGLDNRAIAFKVFGLNGQSLAPGFDGTTSDWHFTTATCVFTKDGVDGAAYFRAVNRGGLGKFLLTHPKDALKVTSTGLSGKLARDLLNVKYSSTAPFAFGPSNSVKFSLQPFSTNAKPNFPLFQDKTNKHRYLLSQALKEKPGKNGFNIYVQQYKDEQSTPVEIGYNDWNTKMELIGSIVIESPSLNETPEAENFCRGVNFNPWNQVPDYQPIGGVQRLRKVIYNNIQQLRRQYQVETGHSVVNGNAVDITLQQVKQAYPLPNELKAKTEMELDEAAEFDEMSEGELDEAEFDDAQPENNAEFDEVDEESAAAEADDASEEFDA